MLAGLGGPDAELGVRRGRRGDRHRVDEPVGQDVVVDGRAGTPNCSPARRATPGSASKTQASSADGQRPAGWRRGSGPSGPGPPGRSGPGRSPGPPARRRAWPGTPDLLQVVADDSRARSSQANTHTVAMPSKPSRPGCRRRRPSPPRPGRCRGAGGCGPPILAGSRCSAAGRGAVVEGVGDVHVGQQRPGVPHDPLDVAALVKGVRRAVQERHPVLIDAATRSTPARRPRRSHPGAVRAQPDALALEDRRQLRQRPPELGLAGRRRSGGR